MSSDNTKLWDILGRTDPAATKGFTRGGGFKGTAIKPVWSFKRMTEEFGPCGTGWGIGAPEFQVLPGSDGETLVYCTTSIWYEKKEQIVWGVGGDKVIAKFSSGPKSDDEAFKKAYTDAITNALKFIGVGADVHMGRFDDSKYVNEMRQEFAEEQPAPPEKQKRQVGYRDDGSRTSYALKTEQPELWDEFRREVDECATLVSLERLRTAWRSKATAEKWNKQYLSTAAEVFGAREEAIRKEMERLTDAEPDELAELPAKTALEHSIASNSYVKNYTAG